MTAALCKSIPKVVAADSEDADAALDSPTLTATVAELGCLLRLLLRVTDMDMDMDMDMVGE